MILTDYYRCTPDRTWEIGRQCGISQGTIRLPEDPDFDVTNQEHWQTIYQRFLDFGIKPIIIEPLPNHLHDHIKAGDAMRDTCIDQVIRMFPIMDALDIRMICFNFMAYIGWLRTSCSIRERGGAYVTGFRHADFQPTTDSISEQQLWENYAYFIKAVIPEAEKYGIRLALHPDDPPLSRLGNVSRIMTSSNNILHAIHGIVQSSSLGITMCQATFHMMGENLYELIPKLKDDIMFIHFRNVTGQVHDFRETFHDNGDLHMAALLKLYCDCGLDVPIRIDHVPTLVGEDTQHVGYDALGRLYAIGYLKGILETLSAL